MNTAPRPLRIFLGAFGQPGHAFPMLALGKGLAQRGHFVWFETWERWRSDVEQAGIEFLPALEFQPFPTREQRVTPYEAVLRATPGTRAAVASIQPDVVVHDILTLAPALAAELQGIPVATLVPHLFPVGARGLPPFGIGARPPQTLPGRAAWNALAGPLALGLRIGRGQLNRTRQALGLPALTRLHGGIGEDLCLVATLPQLEYPREWPAHVHVVGPLIWEPPAEDVVAPPGEEPLILIAPSTAQDPRQKLLRVALEGLADARVRAVGITNRQPATRPFRTGRRSALVQWAPYRRTMPRCDVVVCHAGHGTLVRALTSGTPVVAVPHSGDMGENAARVAWSGAGVRVRWRTLTSRSVRAAVEHVLSERQAFAAPAQAMAAWSRAHDSTATACELVERLATSPSAPSRSVVDHG